MAEKFYAVAFGHKRGVYENWTEVQQQIKGFPQPIYKKFDTREKAQEFVDHRQPNSTAIEVSPGDAGDKFYAIARGRIIGIFQDYDTVKKNITKYPQPMYKKFSTYSQAKEFVEKFANVKVDESAGNKSSHIEDSTDNVKTPAAEDSSSTRDIARKRTTYVTNDDSDGSGNETQKISTSNATSSSEDTSTSRNHASLSKNMTAGNSNDKNGDNQNEDEIKKINNDVEESPTKKRKVED